MPHSTLTPEAKATLRKTIGRLRGELLQGFRDAAEKTYLLGVRIKQAGLSEAAEKRRERLEFWVDEQIRTIPEAEQKKAPAGELRERFLQQAVKEAASTLLNRVILLRIMEAMSAGKKRQERLVAHDVITKGWMSPAYKEFREVAPALCEDETEGFVTLLELVFDELSFDHPGLFGNVGLTRLFPVPPATLRSVIEALNDPALDSAWTDDTTLGWVYQYWNDPDREALDAKINAGGKIEPHEIASKTQMFTERYMVEWLLQNSLGLQWLCICEKHGWTPDAKTVLDDLDKRRAEWRVLRDKGEVALDALMPISGELEDHWKYFVPQPIPKDIVEKVTDSVRTLKILDPACGSGHFLVIAFDLLVALYREEARHRGETWTNKAITEWIVENNLHGVDIDPRAVQIAAAALFVKARAFAPEARMKKMNLVAPALRLARLPAKDPALEKLRKELRLEANIPDELTDKIIKGLAGVDHLGTLLKVDKAIDDALKVYERPAAPVQQFDLFTRQAPAVQVALPLGTTRATVLDKLEPFLARHAHENDLGLRLDGEQLAAGVRFVRMIKEGAFDLVVGNPPYHSTSKLGFSKPFVELYPEARADLFAAFYIRAIELTRPGGRCGYVTLSNWMFLGAFELLRKRMIREGISFIVDFGKGAFSQGSQLITTSACLMTPGIQGPGMAFRLYDRLGEVSETQYQKVAASLLAQTGRHDFDAANFSRIKGESIVYWWSQEFLERYGNAPKLEQESEARKGLCTCDDVRYVRCVWEVRPSDVPKVKTAGPAKTAIFGKWCPTTMGGKGRSWLEPLLHVVGWKSHGIQLKVGIENEYGSVTKRVQSQDMYFVPGVAFSMIGTSFAARAHRYRSIFSNAGSSVFPANVPHTTCLLNSNVARFVLTSLNPTINFEVGDVNRLPIFPIESADQIYATIERAFTEHEAAREGSVEFKKPGPSPWTYAQDWAQRSVDRPAGEPLPAYTPTYEPASPADFLSFAVGVALGRFGAQGEGLLDKAPATALPAGILYISPSRRDSLDHPATNLLRQTWAEQNRGDDESLRDYFRKDFFADHKSRYENRPIYFPLSSLKKNFVAFVSIHRFDVTTFQTLLADHILPDRRALDGELTDLREARRTGTADQKRQAERRFADVQKLLEELDDFIGKINQCADKGAPPSDKDTKPREKDARYVMDLDDGVMVNSAGLWPLLEPQWKDPKKWWKELCNASGKKDYDWSHLAARYFPTRVDEKCRKDPSLGVAHGCFWKYHPAKAYAWELRLQDEIGPDFLIDEPEAQEHRERFLKEKPTEAREIEIKETQRRERKKRKAEGDEQLELLDSGQDDKTEEDDDE